MRFKCKLSQNVVEFMGEFDIEQMKKHPDYEVVSDDEPTAAELQAAEGDVIEKFEPLEVVTEGAKPVKSKRSA